MKTSLGIWAFGGMATRFNPGGYKPELSGISTAEKVKTAVAGLKRSVLQWRFIDGVAAKIDDAALREAQQAKDAVRAYELVYGALGA